MVSYSCPRAGAGKAMTSIRVALADDHQVVRIGVRSMLEKAPDIVVVGEANDGAGALRLVAELSPDILLLDVEMPGMTGVEVARRLQASGSPVRVLALSAYDDESYIAALLASGAAGYLTKDDAMEMLVDAVRGVARGEQGWLSARVRSSAGKVVPGVKGSLG
jgi:DNA-binding NarL/FixJ family response regulator